MVEVAQELFDKLSHVVSVLEALGIIVIIYIIFGIINFFIERKRIKALEQMGKDISEIRKSLSKKR